MGTGAFLLAAFKVLPEVLALINALMARADAKKQQGIGYDQAVKEALQEGAENLKKGDAAELAARKEHATKPGDDAFDPEFMRKD